MPQGGTSISQFLVLKCHRARRRFRCRCSSSPDTRSKVLVNKIVLMRIIELMDALRLRLNLMSRDIHGGHFALRDLGRQSGNNALFSYTTCVANGKRSA